jgi:phosphoglycolate phosphatase-like HAD superfamily hydrolase
MKKTILWDFDGVILDSMKVRDSGFEKIFKDFDPVLIEQLLDYHRKNGGLSRYVKIRYFFEEVLGKSISDEGVLEYAHKFSLIMRKELTNTGNLILDSVNFIESNYNKYNFHIVSGSDGDELRYLCKSLKLSNFFISINGSPTPKNKLVKDVLVKYSYDVNNCMLIGDSINDFEAAKVNKINFLGYNNIEIQGLDGYINNFSNFIF